MSKSILVPLDGSELSARALPYASALARAGARAVVLVRVLTPQPPRGEELVQEGAARSDLNAEADALRTEGLAVQTVLTSTLRGTVAQMILEIAETHGCDLIVMSTHGRGGLGRWLYGSTAEEVLRQAPIPIMLVPTTSDQAWRADAALRVLVPFDGSDVAEAALAPMLASVRGITQEVVLLHVVVPTRGEAAAYMFEDVPAEIDIARTSLERLADTLRDAGWTVRVQVVAGSVTPSIASVAREESVDLIAMPTHGRSGVARLVLGSVATETLKRATTPVLVLRPARLAESPITKALEIDTRESRHRFTILVALDTTEKADAALAPTARLAHATGARVILVNLFDPPIDGGRVVAPRAAADTYIRNERRLYLEDKARQLPGLDVETRVEAVAHGEEIHQHIAHMAAETAADILVVVSKRLSSPTGVILGSVAQGIVRRSPCPVLIVSPTAADVPSTGKQLPLPVHESTPA